MAGRQGGRSREAVGRPVSPLAHTGVRWHAHWLPCEAGRLSHSRLCPQTDEGGAPHPLCPWCPHTVGRTPLHNDDTQMAFPRLALPGGTMRWRGSGGAAPDHHHSPADPALPAHCLRCSGAAASSSRSRGGSGCRSDWRDPGSGSRCCPGTRPLGEGQTEHRLRQPEGPRAGLAFSSRRWCGGGSEGSW